MPLLKSNNLVASLFHNESKRKINLMRWLSKNESENTICVT